MKNYQGLFAVDFYHSIFMNPIEVLNRQKERPSWFYPLVIAGVVSLIVNFYMIYRIGFLRLIAAAMNVNASIDPQAILENAISHKSMILSVQALSTFLGVFITAFVVAKVLWLILVIIGNDVLFRKVLAVVAHVSMLMILVRESMLFLTVILKQNLDQFDFNNPLATNLAFFFHPSSARLARICLSLDLLTFANIFLLAVGISKISHRLSLVKSCLIVIVPWALYTAANLLFSGQ